MIIANDNNTTTTNNNNNDNNTNTTTTTTNNNTNKHDKYKYIILSLLSLLYGSSPLAPLALSAPRRARAEIQ